MHACYVHNSHMEKNVRCISYKVLMQETKKCAHRHVKWVGLTHSPIRTTKKLYGPKRLDMHCNGPWVGSWAFRIVSWAWVSSPTWPVTIYIINKKI